MKADSLVPPDRIILCSKPECQTTAGCKCGWEIGEVRRWPQHTYNEILELRERIAELKRVLLEARPHLAWGNAPAVLIQVDAVLRKKP
jgi:hypothetical protein